jgi:hypothetical protein
VKHRDVKPWGSHIPTTLRFIGAPNDHEQVKEVLVPRLPPCPHVVIGAKEDQIFDFERPPAVIPEIRLPPGSSPDKIPGLLALLQDDGHLATDHLYETVHTRGFHHPHEDEERAASPGQALPKGLGDLFPAGLVRIVVCNPDSPGAKTTRRVTGGRGGVQVHSLIESVLHLFSHIYLEPIYCLIVVRRSMIVRL